MGIVSEIEKGIPEKLIAIVKATYGDAKSRMLYGGKIQSNLKPKAKSD